MGRRSVTVIPYRFMKKVITVDFDNTLAIRLPTAYGGYSTHLNVKVENIVRKEHHIGTGVYIVSFRKDKDKAEMERFVMVNKIPVKGIICTNMQPKLFVLQKLNSNLHIDDDFFTCQEAKKAGITAILVDRDGELVRL